MKQTHVSIPEGHFNFRNKPNAKGERTIYLVYNIDREKVSASTGIAVKPSDWDSKKKQRARKWHENYRKRHESRREKMTIFGEGEGLTYSVLSLFKRRNRGQIYTFSIKNSTN